MFDFDFCNALLVRARVGSGTITAIYYYYNTARNAQGRSYSVVDVDCLYKALVLQVDYNVRL